MSEWLTLPLGSLANFQKGRKVETSEHPREGFAPYLGASAISGVIEEYGDTRIGVMSAPGDVLMLWDGERSGLVGKAQAGVISSTVARLSPKTDAIGEYLYYVLDSKFEWIQGRRTGTGVPHVPKDLARILSITYPKSKNEQRRIAEILSTLDAAIDQTEALIAKHQQIKAGLMHDLFTRGVTADGKLRPTREQAPDLYKESPLGWIPKEWSLKTISAIADSLVDGPFGSNLKSEHYVAEPGVRVVRLQNIQEGYYNDRDPVFVSQRHADYLMRNGVNPGDVLIAALGDESYPVGRACCYPPELPPAINKADCFRLRCHPEGAINTYVMHFLNTAAARNQIKRFEQGVTRRRTNLGNLRRVIAALPSLDEQKCIIQRLAVAGEQISTGELQVEKLRQQKHGLMHDLLTGRVRVPITEQ
ncbi:restriction endonuclease subunit S [Acidithiobacillus ferriphilus]|uniref:restriction endonuclease subunit S n=1 Tax=Acidithiobacillus ferriphilus TaxID=1689834 RepID=UPI001C0717BB|nr:restriction endonuclease subunit S [Acidithiobacillus ferriphilus]MBU2854954.1 restriction endonuclease subunit S [Acidithiobacillus ferriphilus]